MLFRYDSLPFRSFPISFVSSGSIASLFVVNISANAFIFLLIFSVLRCRQSCLCGDAGLGGEHAWCGNDRMTGLRRGPCWCPHACALCGQCVDRLWDFLQTCEAWPSWGSGGRACYPFHNGDRDGGSGAGWPSKLNFLLSTLVVISRSWGGRWKPMLITWTKDSQAFVSGKFQTSGLACFVEKASLVKRMSAKCIIKETFLGQLLFQISM